MRFNPFRRSQVQALAVKARVFSFAMASPKPFHRSILENWAQLPESYQFYLVTDCPELWEPLIDGLKNISLVTMSMEEWFLAAERAIEPSRDEKLPGPTFAEVYGANRNGWVACSLRPLLPQIIPVESCEVWGWIDWDVFLNPPLLQQHLDHATETDIMLFPRDGMMWEHFKLFRRTVDLLPIAKRVMSEGSANSSSPMCAMTSYAIGALEYSYRRDGLPQQMIVAHWAYSDKLHVKNGVTVRQFTDGYLTDSEGCPVMFFVADTQVKDWSDEDVAEYKVNLTAAKSYTFEFVPKLG